MFVPGPHNTGAYYVDAAHRERTDRWGYAGAYRAGDLVFLSGVVLISAANEELDVEGYKVKTRGLFDRAAAVFDAAGATLREVVDIVSFHVWDSPCWAPALRDDRLAQFEIFASVRREFMHEPHPAWTAVGSSGLIVGDHGLVEMRMVAYAPR